MDYDLIVLENSLSGQIHKLFMYIISQKVAIMIHERRLIFFAKNGKESKDEFINKLAIFIA